MKRDGGNAVPFRVGEHSPPSLFDISLVCVLIRGSGWVPVGFADFKSVGVHPSMCAEGSTPLHSRQPIGICMMIPIS